MSKQVRGSNSVDDLDIQSAVDFMEDASKHVFHLSKELVAFAAAATAMVNGPLTMEAIVALMQASLPRKRGGGGGVIPAETIILVLEAAAGLGTKFIKPGSQLGPQVKK